MASTAQPALKCQSIKPGRMVNTFWLELEPIQSQKRYQVLESIALQKNRVISVFNRSRNPHLQGEIVGIFNNNRVTNLMYFVVYQNQTFIVCVADLLEGDIDELCSYEGGRIIDVKISNDARTIYVIHCTDDDQEHYLYAFQIGVSVDFDEDEVEPITSLGTIVHSVKVEGVGLIVVYNSHSMVHLGTLIDGDFKRIEDKFDYLDDTNEFKLMQNNNIICLKRMEHDSIEYVIMGSKHKSFEECTYKIKEFSCYKYNYPYLVVVKGGNEIIKYDFLQNKFTYAYINSSFVALQQESSKEMC